MWPIALSPEIALGERDRGVGVLALEEASRCRGGVNHSRAFIFRMVSPTTEKRKWPGLDEPGMDGADRDLVDAGPFDRDEWERLGVGPHRWRRPGVVAASGATPAASAGAGPGAAGTGARPG